MSCFSAILLMILFSDNDISLCSQYVKLFSWSSCSSGCFIVILDIVNITEKDFFNITFWSNIVFIFLIFAQNIGYFPLRHISQFLQNFIPHMSMSIFVI